MRDKGSRYPEYAWSFDLLLFHTSYPVILTYPMILWDSVIGIYPVPGSLLGSNDGYLGT